MSAMKRRSKTSAALLLPRVSSNQWKNADVLSSFASSSSLSLKRKPVVAIHSSMYITAYVAYAVAIASMMLGRISDAQGLLTFAIQLGARIEQRGRGGLIQSHEGRECKNWDGELGESSLKRMIEDARELFEFIRREGSFPKEENRSNVRLATSHQSRPSTSMRTRSSKGSSLRETTSDVGGRLLLPPRPHSALARIEHGH
ncbi:hypothetical protein GUITHDRAFT_156173 [Guillardia theta CCMP2712]|uniref:Uncharacterized protein n=2 Tax=Guillardia theta TaxID=55529 RepID=L1IB23_GUITC|nr:hypothetical protein GUITHDRAFT_156173 [Guillardia theta CCMP2712]EKX33050.1 hypothetical protein GUITHDRAFT_156173 [Guillardia theta CCMP2712]|eukprot:XP_005820030.1 hypothetical protein GUITHDRAFT_156173 [Guillardia theta CCMP2712]